MKFCEECNNLLYPHEGADKTLVYTCRICGHTQRAERSDEPIYTNEIKHTSEEKTHVIQDVTADPSLPRATSQDNVVCQRCGNEEAVFFQAPMRRADEQMTLYFVCTRCNHQWTE